MKQMRKTPQARTLSQLQRDALFGWWERLTPEKQGGRLFEDFYKEQMTNFRLWINNQDRPEDLALAGHQPTRIIIDEILASGACPNCLGKGFTQEHDHHAPDDGEFCAEMCPVKQICDRCKMTGKISTSGA